MNIKEAKEQIQNAMEAYFTKDDLGAYMIPPEKQRPVFLMGPPGIGKTAIMEQVAQELGVGLVSYSMTHHTRQSALGLPFIVQKTYGGVEYDVSEYTMSEIIASIYDMIELSGIQEGILFLDEINCVSETLAPVMLQFLQYKIFGRHHLPEGWIVVAAGNPPEYNHSVREFDIATWDRLKRIDVEPDFDAWKEYAYKKGIHPSIMTYLELKKEHFYSVESTARGKRFVTARGWDDLSIMMTLYEQKKLPIDEGLISQYLQNPEIAGEFAAYYSLFKKYRNDYQLDAILSGEFSQELVERASISRFDERLSFLGLLLDSISARLRAVMEEETGLKSLLQILREIKTALLESDSSGEQMLSQAIARQQKRLDTGRIAGILSREEQRMLLKLLSVLEEQKALVQGIQGGLSSFGVLKTDFEARKRTLDAHVKNAGEELSHIFQFCEQAFGDGQEMLILATELTAHYYCAKFISHYGCKEYYAHNQELLLHGRQKEILEELEELTLEERG